MKPELWYLALVTAFTGLLWVPYVLDRMMVRGLPGAVGYPENPKPQSGWAQRLMKAHANAVENLVVFAPLVLVANMMGVTSPAVASSAVVFFWARVIHAVSFTLGLPWIRTGAFVIGFGCQACVAWHVLLR